MPIAPLTYTGPRHRWRTDLLAAQFATHVSPSAGPVLDLGCGAGRLTRLLAARGYDVMSADLDPRGLAVLRRGTMSWGAGSVAPLRADAQALPLPDGCLAAVVCGEALEHVADDGLALREARRALRPGGVLLLTVPAGAARMGDVDRAVGHRRRYDRAGLAARLSASGLELMSLRPWGFPFGRLYDRLVQAPALRARGARPRRVLARLGRNAVLDRAWRALFAADERLCSVAGDLIGERGTGWLALARRPATGPS